MSDSDTESYMSDSDHVSDNDINIDIVNNNANYLKKNINNNGAETIKKIIVDDDAIKINYNQQKIVQKNMVECGMCGKKSDDIRDYGVDGEAVCVHCWFWLNASIFENDKIETSMICVLNEYLDKYLESHSVIVCTKKGTGCILCMYKQSGMDRMEQPEKVDEEILFDTNPSADDNKDIYEQFKGKSTIVTI